jgi:3-isopropylmalate dehydrogenase
MKARIVLLPGDGIGPEVIEQARLVLESVAAESGHEFTFDERPIGGMAIDAYGDPLPPESLEACRTADAALLGAVGGPKWSDPNAPVRPEQGLLRLRGELGLYANLRPIRPMPGASSASPLRPELLDGVDLLIVRELTGGLYYGEPRYIRTTDAGRRTVDTLAYTEHEIRRVVRKAFELARGRRKKVTSVDKANVLDSSRLWRQVAEEVAAENGDVVLEHQLVDSAAARLMTAPASFDVLVTENMFGDILSDEASVLCGSLGLIPSASLSEGSFGLYEPIHGSAPDIAGREKADPIGAILSAAMLLRHSLGLQEEARAVEAAVQAALDDGARTADLGGRLTTDEMGEVVRGRMKIAEGRA